MALDFTTSFIKLNNQYTIVGTADDVEPTTVPKKGELYFGPVENGIRTCKIGDGETIFQNLPLLGIDPANNDSFGSVKSGGDVNISEGIISLKPSGISAGTYRSVTVNSKGIVTGGSNTDSDTHHTAYNYVGAADNASNSQTTNGNTYLKLYENGTKRSQFKIQGAGSTQVTSDASGNITITSTIEGISDKSSKVALQEADSAAALQILLNPNTGTSVEYSSIAYASKLKYNPTSNILFSNDQAQLGTVNYPWQSVVSNKGTFTRDLSTTGTDLCFEVGSTNTGTSASLLRVGNAGKYATYTGFKRTDNASINDYNNSLFGLDERGFGLFRFPSAEGSIMVGAYTPDGWAWSIARSGNATFGKVGALSFDGPATQLTYGTSSTSSSTVAKAATTTLGYFPNTAGASIADGTRITIYFSQTNTADTPTLNINTTGAKKIYHQGSQITKGTNKGLLSGYVDFIYREANDSYHIVGNYINTNVSHNHAIATYNAAGFAKPAYTSTGAATLTTSAASNTSTPTIAARTTTAGRYYGVESDKNGVLFVNVPWTSGADGNTTYSISKAGSTITLTGSDGTTSSVTDSNTTYTHPSAPTSASTARSGQEVQSSSSGIGLITNVSVGINNTGHVADVTLEYASATVGGATYGMFVENGMIKAGTKYAGGTRVTLNGEAKGGNSVTFYAPTGVGNKGQFLQSTGSGAPTWSNLSSIIPTQIYISGTPRSATFSDGVLSFS